MYTKRRFSFKKLLSWTRRELVFFTIIVTIFTALYEFFDLKWMQIPLTPVGLVGTAVAFMIGFQNNAAYDRIWEARKIWGGIVNTSRTLIMVVRDSFHLGEQAVKISETETIKTITLRHIAWLTALRYAMRAKKEWETTYTEKLKNIVGGWYNPEEQIPLEDELKKLLSSEELKTVLHANNKPNAIIALQSAHFRSLTDSGKLWNFTLLKLQNILEELTALQGKSERIKNFPYPKQYGSISYHFVHIFMWLLPMAMVPHFENVAEKIAILHPWASQYFVWFNIPCTVVVIWIFNTMLRIGMAGENPFEGSANDVPISNISRGISRDILELINEPSDTIAPPFANENHIQL